MTARGALAFVLLVMTVLLLRRIDDASLHYPDADRIRMDGVFVLDFLKALPLRRIYAFTAQYYAQYPAIDIGYRPPFFPLAEAGFNAVFGVNVWSSRLTVLPFAFAGTAAWFALVRRLFGTATAFWATLLFATTPFVVQWGWYTMSDLPLLFMAMLLAYCFHRSTESLAPRYVYATALVFAVAVWIKQTAIFLPVWLVVYLGVRRQLIRYAANVHVWVASVAALIALAPIMLMTLRLGTFNLAQSVGVSTPADVVGRFDWDNLMLYPALLVNARVPAVTLPALGLGVGGLVLALWKRDSRLLFFGLLIVTTYAFFTYVIAKEPRYTMPWIPAFLVFAALPLAYLHRAPGWRRVYMLGLAAVCAYQVTRVYAIEPYYATGYEQAARHVVDHRDSNMVFFDGGHDGAFTYFVRALDRDRSIYVLRGDKLLTSSALNKQERVQVHARSRQDILDILDKYGVTDVVVEGTETSTVPIHHELRGLLDDGPFHLVKTIPAYTNLPDVPGQNTLKIYRYLDAKPMTADTLELPVPLVGVTVTVPLRRATDDPRRRAPASDDTDAAPPPR